MAILEELNEEFGNFCINVDKNTLDTCVTLCREHRISAEDLVYGWVAFCSEKGRRPPTVPLLESMVRAKFGERHQSSQRANDSKVAVYSAADTDLTSSGDSAGLSQRSSQQSARRQLPSASITPKRIPGQVPPRDSLFSPTSYSPNVASPSERYVSRTNRGQPVCTWGPERADWSTGGHVTCAVTRLSGQGLEQPFRYMFERLADTADVLTDHILTMGEKLKAQYQLEEFVQPHTLAPEPVCVVGRISCDGEGRLNSKSLLLEAGGGLYGEGKELELNVSELKDVGLFTGQVVAVRGLNPTGHTFVASEIFTSIRPPSPDRTATSAETQNKDVTVMVACGPFTTSEDVLYSPLRDLLQEVVKIKPHALLLIGPFIDSKIVENELAETYHDLWTRLKQLILTALKDVQTKVLLMSSPFDLHAEPVLPTPAFTSAPDTPFTMLPNPCCFSLDGLVIGATSVDTLMHLSQQEIKLPGPADSDRLSRLAGHLLDQQSFYPLYPADESIGVDYQQWRKHCRLRVTPDVLVTPSDFKAFVKDVHGCLVVNPWRLARGASGGSYAILRAPANPPDGLAPDTISAKVVRI